VVPWAKLEALIYPHYPKLGPKGGRRPFPLALMLRIYCLQQWYNLSDLLDSLDDYSRPAPRPWEEGSRRHLCSGGEGCF
jgi:hypothetical protein